MILVAGFNESLKNYCCIHRTVHNFPFSHPTQYKFPQKLSAQFNIFYQLTK